MRMHSCVQKFQYKWDSEWLRKTTFYLKQWTGLNLCMCVLLLCLAVALLSNGLQQMCVCVCVSLIVLQKVCIMETFIYRNKNHLKTITTPMCCETHEHNYTMCSETYERICTSESRDDVDLMLIHWLLKDDDFRWEAVHFCPIWKKNVYIYIKIYRGWKWSTMSEASRSMTVKVWTSTIIPTWVLCTFRTRSVVETTVTIIILYLRVIVFFYLTQFLVSGIWLKYIYLTLLFQKNIVVSCSIIVIIIIILKKFIYSGIQKNK